MHASAAAWVAAKVNERDLAAGDTLEVGSLNVNGSVRPLFAGSYIGVDMRPGPGVDQVAEASALPFDDATFDLVVSTEMLEHDATFWLSVPEMARVLRSTGVLILTARGIGFPLHDHPHDYWRFTTDALRSLLTRAGLSAVEVAEDPGPGHPGVFALAVKP